MVRKNPSLSAQNPQPATTAGFDRKRVNGDTSGTRKKKRFLNMQYRPPKIYPLDSLQDDLDELLSSGKITPGQYTTECENITLKALAVKKWFVYYSFMNPFTGAWERFKVYEDINRQPADLKIKYAKDLRDALSLTLRGGYSPYDEEQKALHLQEEKKKRADSVKKGDKSSLSLLQGLNIFLSAKKVAGKGKKTISAYNTIANIVKNWLNNNELLLVPANTIEGPQYLELLQQAAQAGAWSNKTYNNRLLYLETILNWLAQPLNGKIIPHNPIKGAEQREILERKPSAYTDEELENILKAVRDAKDYYLEGIILTCYYAAVRSNSEMRGLKVGNILFDRDLLLLSADATKARREDYIPLDPHLKEYYLNQGIDKLPKDWYVFGYGGKPGLKPANDKYYANIYRPYRLQFNIPDEKNLYNWKHTRALHLGKSKVDIYAIKQLFRHKSIEETENYMRDLGLIIDRGAVQSSRKL